MNLFRDTNKDSDTKNGRVDTGQKGGTNWEIRIALYTLPCRGKLPGACSKAQGAQLGAGDLEESDEEGGVKEVQEEDIYMQLIHFVVQQKLTQHYKAIASHLF